MLFQSDILKITKRFGDQRGIYLQFLTPFLSNHLLMSAADATRLDDQPQAVVARASVPDEETLVEMVGDNIADFGVLSGAFGNLALVRTNTYREAPPSNPLSSVYFGSPTVGYTFLFRSELRACLLRGMPRDQAWEVLDTLFTGGCRVYCGNAGKNCYTIPRPLEMNSVGDCTDWVYEGDFVQLPCPDELISNGITGKLRLDGMPVLYRFDDGRPMFHTTLTLNP